MCLGEVFKVKKNNGKTFTYPIRNILIMKRKITCFGVFPYPIRNILIMKRKITCFGLIGLEMVQEQSTGIILWDVAWGD